MFSGWTVRGALGSASSATTRVAKGAPSPAAVRSLRSWRRVKWVSLGRMFRISWRQATARPHMIYATRASQQARPQSQRLQLDHVRCGSRVVVEHEMAPVGIGALPMPPAGPGSDAGVALKHDVARHAAGAATPVLERILAVPDDVAVIGDVLLHVGAFTNRSSAVAHFPIVRQVPEEDWQVAVERDVGLLELRERRVHSRSLSG